MGLKIDKNNTGFKALEAGTYEVYPVAFDATTAKSSGNNMAVVNYLVRDDVEQAGQGQEIRFDNFVETDAALWRMNQAGTASHMDEDKEYESIHEWAADFMGRPIRVDVKLTERNGRQYPEVAGFKESLAGGFMSPQKMEEYKAKKAGNAVGNAKPKKDDPFKADANANAAPVDISDDDLPF